MAVYLGIFTAHENKNQATPFVTLNDFICAGDCEDGAQQK